MADGITYALNFTDPTVAPIMVAPKTVDTSSTPISMIGYGYESYGELLQENLLKMLENFSSQVPPANPVRGMVWYSRSQEMLKVYTGVEWIDVGSKVTSGGTLPEEADPGEMFYRGDTNALYVYDGSIWSAIATANQLNAHVDDATVHITQAERNKLAILPVIDSGVADVLTTLDTTLDGIDTQLGGINAQLGIVDQQLNAKLSRTGGSMSGDLELFGSPVTDNSAVSKGYVSTAIADALAGGADLPVATETTTGVVKVGSGLSVAVDGTLTATATAPDLATVSTPGVVKVGSGLSLDVDGTISVPPVAVASATVAGVVKVGAGLTMSAGVMSVDSSGINGVVQLDQVGMPSGVASLGSDGRIPSSQLPSGIGGGGGGGGYGIGVDGSFGGASITNYISKQSGDYVIAAVGGVIDLAAASVHGVDVTANTTISLTGVLTGAASIVAIVVNNGGSYSVTWPTSFDWGVASVPNLKPSGSDLIIATTIDNGTSWRAIAVWSKDSATTFVTATPGDTPAFQGGSLPSVNANGDIDFGGSTITNYITKQSGLSVNTIIGGVIDLAKGIVQKVTITEATALSITGLIAGASHTVILHIENGGSAVVSWPASVDFGVMGVPSLNVSGHDMIGLMTVDGGTTWRATRLWNKTV